MSDRLTVTSRDLRRLLDVADAGRISPATGGLPDATLEAVRALVPCTTVAYNVVHPRTEDWLFGSSIGDATGVPADRATLAEATDRMRAETMACTYTYLTSDRTTVYRATDFFSSERDYFAGAYGDWLSATGGRFDVLVPLSQTSECDHRLVLFRDEGRDFSDRELMLLRLVRPHLLELDGRAHPAEPPVALTARQTQVLRAVSAGLTNHQVARRLGMSEGTVRTHLMHIYDLLGVQSRAGAVAVFLADDRSPHHPPWAPTLVQE